MQLTLKPLKGDNFTVEVDPEDTVEDVKKKVAALKDIPADSQKLIYSGKILADTQIVKDLDIKPESFIVCMVTKAKAPAAAPATAPAATPTPAPGPAPTAPDATAQASSAVVAGGAAEDTIKQLVDMGFGRPEVERCLAAAFGNPDRAVEYLMNGIPEGAGDAPMPQALPSAGGAPAPAGAGGASPFPSMAGAGGGAARVEIPPALQQIRDSPQFVQMAQLVASNPQMLAQMLPALQQSNPEVFQAIQEHPQAFMQMLQEATGGGGGGGGMGGMGGGGMPAAGDPQLAAMAQMLQQNPEMVNEMLPELEARDPALAAAVRENPQALIQMLQQVGSGAMPGMGGGGMPGGGEGGGVVRLTEEENAAVERLAALGFDKNMCAQAYLACDKNEELAANFLFDNAGS